MLLLPLPPCLKNIIVEYWNPWYPRSCHFTYPWNDAPHNRLNHIIYRALRPSSRLRLITQRERSRERSILIKQRAILIKERESRERKEREKERKERENKNINDILAVVTEIKVLRQIIIFYWNPWYPVADKRNCTKIEAWWPPTPFYCGS